MLGLFTLAWKLWFANALTIRIPPTWTSRTLYAGTQTFADPRTGLLPDTDQLARYERYLDVIDARNWPVTVTVRDRNSVFEPVKDSVIWQYVTTAEVDPQTGARAGGAHAGEIVVFPRNVRKQTYTLRTSYMKGIPLAFEREELVDGLKAYVFGYRGPGEYTKSYAGSEKYPGIILPAGQEIRCADDQFHYRVWIEPHTGMQVRVEEGCPSGDYAVEAATGRRLQAIDRFSGVSSGNGLARRVEEAYRERWRVMWVAVYFPIITAAFSGVFILLSLLRRKNPDS